MSALSQQVLDSKFETRSLKVLRIANLEDQDASDCQPVGPYEMGARNDSFLPNAMKTLFRLSRVLLGL